MTDFQPRGHVTPSGHYQEVNPGRQEAASQDLDRRAIQHNRMGAHLWLVIVSYAASDALLDAQDGEVDHLGILDAENMLGAPQIGCYLCETPYTPQARRRRCKGDPNLPR